MNIFFHLKHSVLYIGYQSNELLQIHTELEQITYHNTSGSSLLLPVNTSNSSTTQPSNQSLYKENLISNDNKTLSDNNLDISYLNQTEETDEDSFVKGSAGVWVISVMSGTCLLTIAFIVRGLFSRAEAFHDPPDNYHGTDINGGVMGVMGILEQIKEIYNWELKTKYLSVAQM
ncbi:unnamed protein product [Heterobilharzia americana]|nr:unnamed protein product [Heterobilharzia americana]